MELTALFTLTNFGLVLCGDSFLKVCAEPGNLEPVLSFAVGFGVAAFGAMNGL